MRRFLNNLLRDFRSNKAARPARRAPRRATLQVEGLEDRLVMTTANPLVSAALLNHVPAGPSVAQTKPIVKVTTTKLAILGHPATTLVGESITFGQPGTIFIRSDGHGNTVVTELGQNPIQFPTAPVRSFSLFVQNGSFVHIDDSNGMPFAYGTAVDLNGNGGAQGIFLSLEGSRTVSGNETYVAGGMPQTPGVIYLDNSTFTLHSAITGVFDSIPITGLLDVQTSGTGVQLNSYGPGYAQYLSGMGVGGGDNLGYENKPAVNLETYAPNASIFLDAPDAAVGEGYFGVLMHAAGETTTLDQTPKNVLTVANAQPSATNASVAVWGNFGPVIIDGNASTGVNIGYPLASTGTITSGIEAVVTVNSASYLVVNNSGNVSTPENVKVTEDSISGSGLFGNNNVIVNYSNVGTLILDTGHVSDTYTVVGSRPGARFSSNIDIIDLCAGQFHADVFVDSGSHLNLSLNKVNLGSAAGLTIHPGGGNVVLPGRLPRRPESGTADVYFAGILSSQVSFLNFDAVGVQE
jgi:hypothetical protein